MTRSFMWEIGAALVEHVSSALGMRLGTEVQVTPGVHDNRALWHAEVTAEGSASGSYVLAIDASGASAVASLIAGVEQPAAHTVIDTYREICNEALGLVSATAASKGMTLKLAAITFVGEQQTAGAEVFALTTAKLAAPVMVAVWTNVQSAAADTQSPPANASKAATAAAPRPAPHVASKLSRDRMQVILDMDLPLTARFGRTEMPLKALTRIGPGSVIDLGRSAEEPVEVLVSNRVVARGEVVIVSGNYAIRILDVISSQDRTGLLEEE